MFGSNLSLFVAGFDKAQFLQRVCKLWRWLPQNRTRTYVNQSDMRLETARSSGVDSHEPGLGKLRHHFSCAHTFQVTAGIPVSLQLLTNLTTRHNSWVHSV